MLKIRKEFLHDIFLIGIFIKGIDGILELIAGIILLITKSNFISNFVQRIFQHELFEDPKDLIANYFVQTSTNISVSLLLFVAIYLIIHGIIKIGIFLGLWYKQAWAYPIAAIVLSLFVIYQSIRLFSNHSIILLFLILVDISIIILLRFEYKRVKHSNK